MFLVIEFFTANDWRGNTDYTPGIPHSSNGRNVPKARIARTDINDCYLEVAIRI